VNPFDGQLVLVVDDEQSIRDLLRILLSRVNLRVVTAENGQEALVKIGDQRPDIILLDIMMPVMDGYECASRLHAKDAFRAIPIIFVSAKGEEKDKAQAYACGASDYLVKPVPRPVLLEAIRTHMIERGPQ